MIEGTCHCGKVHWTYAIPVEGVTACNCTSCRRYGALWAYGFLGEEITVSGPTKTYAKGSKISDVHFCADCGCVSYYLLKTKNKEGQLKVAVNMRMANDPQAIAAVPIDHFDGLDTFEDLPRDHRQVKDLWF